MKHLEHHGRITPRGLQGRMVSMGLRRNGLYWPRGVRLSYNRCKFFSHSSRKRISFSLLQCSMALLFFLISSFSFIYFYTSHCFDLVLESDMQIHPPPPPKVAKKNVPKYAAFWCRMALLLFLFLLLFFLLFSSFYLLSLFFLFLLPFFLLFYSFSFLSLSTSGPVTKKDKQIADTLPPSEVAIFT